MLLLTAYQIELYRVQRQIMTERNTLICVYANASGYLWSMSMTDSGTNLGYSEYNGDCKMSGSFTTYDKALEDAINVAKKVDLNTFRTYEKNWSSYANFARSFNS